MTRNASGAPAADHATSMRSIAASRFEICACKEARRSLIRPASARTWRASLPRRASARFALGIAQRIARLAGGGLFLFELAADGVDAPAQRFEIFFLTCTPGRPGDQPEQQKNNAVQTFAFPCAATEATRRATSAGSPR